MSSDFCNRSNRTGENLTNGQLIIVVGPSGAGKDTLIDGAKKVLSGDPYFYFPRREITRPEDAGGEDHTAVTMDQYNVRSLAGEYALSWRAHNTGYGISRSMEDHLNQGKTVVANISRTVIDEARACYPGTATVLVTAPRELLAERISARGREQKIAVEERLARSEQVDVSGSDVLTIVNDGPLENALNAFIVAISGRTLRSLELHRRSAL